MIIETEKVSQREIYPYLTGAVGPRPICFASTVDINGKPNLAPFSFFNVFGSTPPVFVFSNALRRDGSMKNTLENIHAIREVVINVVTYDMVWQSNLASSDYDKDINEFKKAGFTAVKAEKVKPFLVKESPVNFECKVTKIIESGDQPGSGILIYCELLLMHINDTILDESKHIDPHKIDLVGRMGANYYCRAQGNAIFEVPKPGLKIGIGIDALQENIRHSKVLSGNQLARLAGTENIPAVNPNFHDEHLKNIFEYYSRSPESMETELHLYAGKLIDEGDIENAWQVLLARD